MAAGRPGLRGRAPRRRPTSSAPRARRRRFRLVCASSASCCSSSLFRASRSSLVAVRLQRAFRRSTRQGTAREWSTCSPGPGNRTLLWCRAATCCRGCSGSATSFFAEHRLGRLPDGRRPAVAVRVAWPRVGYRQATLTAVFAGFITCVVLGVYAMWQNDVLVLCLCLFVFVSCKNQWMILETGGEDPLLGHYDFSQGYTSLERGKAAARPPSELVAALDAAADGEENPARTGAAEKTEEAPGRAAGQDPASGPRLPDGRGATLPQARQRTVSESELVPEVSHRGHREHRELMAITAAAQHGSVFFSSVFSVSSVARVVISWLI